MNVVEHGNGKEFQGFTVRGSPYITDRVDIFLIRAPSGIEIRLIPYTGICYTHYLKFDFYNERKWKAKYSNICAYMLDILVKDDVLDMFDNCDDCSKEFKRIGEIVLSQLPKDYPHSQSDFIRSLQI